MGSISTLELQTLNTNIYEYTVFKKKIYILLIPLLQTFLSSRAVYIVVFNLCHDLEKPVPNADANTGNTDVSVLLAPLNPLSIYFILNYELCSRNFRHL